MSDEMTNVPDYLILPWLDGQTLTVRADRVRRIEYQADGKTLCAVEFVTNVRTEYTGPAGEPMTSWWKDADLSQETMPLRDWRTSEWVGTLTIEKDAPDAD